MNLVRIGIVRLRAAASGIKRRRMQRAAKFHLTDADLRYQYQVMVRWCRRFEMSDRDWIELAASRFRERHPVVDLRQSGRKAA